MSKRHASRGVTLVELLVVLAIITILAGILATVIIRARQAPYVVSCKVQMKGMISHIKSFEWSNGRLPTAEELDLVEHPCPAPGGGLYEYYPSTDENAILLVCKSHMRKSGVVMVGRHDGSVRGIPNARYDGP